MEPRWGKGLAPTQYIYDLRSAANFTTNLARRLLAWLAIVSPHDEAIPIETDNHFRKSVPRRCHAGRLVENAGGIIRHALPRLAGVGRAEDSPIGRAGDLAVEINAVRRVARFSRPRAHAEREGVLNAG